MKEKFLYNKNLKIFARSNKNDPTYGEIKLWKNLRNQQLLGYKFRRQYPVNKYILDFYCHELKLCIEIDGSTHEFERIDKDKIRDERLRGLGIYTLRFREYDVLRNINDVLETICAYIDGFRFD